MIDAIAERNMQALSENTYPGRGIILGKSDAGRLVQVYWVMGRSENSRNRILAMTTDEYNKEMVETKAFDPSKVKDPSLIIYNAMRGYHRWQIVSNGDQTDTVFEHFMGADGDIEGALERRFNEPDAPNFTPRITGLTNKFTEKMILSKISQNLVNPKESVRAYYHYKDMTPGFGYCLHTYNGDGDPLPPFDRDPYPVLLQGDTAEIGNRYWNLLNEQNRVALVVKTVSIGIPDNYYIINALSPQTNI